MKIFKNISATKRALEQLQRHSGFSSTALDFHGNTIVYLQWILLSRRVNNVGRWECYAGPHFSVGDILVSDIEKIREPYLFSVDGKYVCMTISRDLGFSEKTSYKLDFVGQFFLYRAELDEPEFAYPPQ